AAENFQALAGTTGNFNVRGPCRPPQNRCGPGSGGPEVRRRLFSSLEGIIAQSRDESGKLVIFRVGQSEVPEKCKERRRVPGDPRGFQDALIRDWRLAVGLRQSRARFEGQSDESQAKYAHESSSAKIKTALLSFWMIRDALSGRHT